MEEKDHPTEESVVTEPKGKEVDLNTLSRGRDMI